VTGFMMGEVRALDRRGVVHVALQTYWSDADTTCGQRVLFRVVEWAPPGVPYERAVGELCADCFGEAR
jgi:hypothetical protein